MKAKEIAFMGKITAGITHEMNNVLATIKESGGLMEDIIALSREQQLAHQDKFNRSLAAIKAQVQRGVELSTRLNKFSHSMDDPRAAVEPSHLVDLAVFLNQRFARQKQAVLIAEAPPEARNIKTNPFLVLMVLTYCVEACLAEARPESKIFLKPGKSGNDQNIKVLLEQPGGGSVGAALPELSDLEEAVAALSAGLSPVSEAPRAGYCLSFNNVQ